MTAYALPRVDHSGGMTSNFSAMPQERTPHLARSLPAYSSFDQEHHRRWKPIQTRALKAECALPRRSGSFEHSIWLRVGCAFLPRCGQATPKNDRINCGCAVQCCRLASWHIWPVSQPAFAARNQGKKAGKQARIQRKDRKGTKIAKIPGSSARGQTPRRNLCASRDLL